MFVCHAATRRFTVVMGTANASNIEHGLSEEHMTDCSAAGSVTDARP